MKQPQCLREAVLYILIQRLSLMKQLSFILLFFTLLCFKTDAASAFSPVKGETCATCRGKANCNACKTCNYCAHCNAGGSCGVCSSGTAKPNKSTVKPVYKVSDQQGSAQCKGTTKKGLRCKRMVRGGGNCFQH